MKSCKKPSCEAVDNQKQCFAVLKEAGKQTVASTVVEEERQPAAEKKKAGVIEEVAGDVKVAREGKHEVGLKDFVVFEGDSVETGPGGKARVRFEDGSKMMVAASSKVQIEVMQVDAAAKKRRIALSLLTGKIRNRVEKKLENENIFEVKTRTAVAGVRGTDFVTSFEADDKQWVTKVQTLEGKVRLADFTQSDFLDDKEASTLGERLVEAGSGASLVVTAPKVDDEISVKKAVQAGVLSPSFLIKEDEIKAIKEETEFASIKAIKAAAREVASVTSEAVCTEPSGLFNQCSFTCENNIKGAKTCRTDLPGVACVRKLCRANGKWNEAARLPASGGSLCDPKKVVVRECGTYW